jgi:hypothetical protein
MLLRTEGCNTRCVTTFLGLVGNRHLADSGWTSGAVDASVLDVPPLVQVDVVEEPAVV